MTQTDFLALVLAVALLYGVWRWLFDDQKPERADRSGRNITIHG